MKVKQDLKDNLDKMRDYFNKLRADDIDQKQAFRFLKEKNEPVCLFCHLAVCFDLTHRGEEYYGRTVCSYYASFEKSDYWEDFRELIYDSIRENEDFSEFLYPINPDDSNRNVSSFYKKKIRVGKGLGEFLFNAVKDRLQVLESKKYGWEF